METSADQSLSQIIPSCVAFDSRLYDANLSTRINILISESTFSFHFPGQHSLENHISEKNMDMKTYEQK